MNRPRPRVALIGVHGHGRVHLEGLLERERAGVLELCGVADRRDPELPDHEYDTDAVRLLEKLRPDIAVISTPIHTHLEIAEAALGVGAHLLLEKPPVTSVADHERLLAAVTAANRHCQVGFQAFGSSAVDQLIANVRGGVFGEIERVAMSGCWWRGYEYYGRSPWAGKRTLGGVTVADGVLTNPFAHGVALALRLAGEQVRSVLVEPYRAYDIETDDTACARVETDGAPVTLAATLCAERESEPYVRVFGTRGTATIWYTEDRLMNITADGESEEIGERVALVDDLIRHLDDDPAGDEVLRCPLRSTRAFTEVLEAIQHGPAPRAVPEDHVNRVGERGRTIPGIEDAVAHAVATGRMFSELDLLPWI
ncbi:MAG TPA: Gfo/Idh/MocA family oxidoreductase [Actinospica sp.]|jgi:predicted dehydrogenase|nr:Gfo/Idh/MocA family oxidoreductase [Actinospica sp.]